MRFTSEGPVKITKATVDAAWRRRAVGRRHIVRDLECRGLALIVNPTGMTWSYAYRPRGNDPITGKRFPNRTMTIGNPATHSPDDARVEANRIKGKAVTGRDPATEKRAQAAAERRKQAVTVGRLLEDYATALPKRQKARGDGVPAPAYVAVEVAQARFAIAALEASGLPISSLQTIDVRRMLDQGGAGSNMRARFGALSRFLDWCQDAGHIDANPCALVIRGRRPNPPAPRSHYLTPAELATLWTAAHELTEPVWRDYCRFLIAVPCRRGEASRMEWSHVDIDKGEWRQPGKMTKNRDPHRLHLHPLAIGVLRSRRELTGGRGLVFPAPESGNALNTFSRLKARLSTAAALTGWTWHDFRGSFATALGEAGIPETVADAVLNHRQAATRGGVLGVYQRASRWPEQIKAMEHWGRLLAAALDEGDAEAQVIPTKARIG